MVIKEKPLPPVGDNQPPAAHIDISDRFWDEHLPIELDKGNRLQASEKIWGSVAHTIIAIGKQRGWEVGETHGALRAVVVQLGAELDGANGVRANATEGDRNQFRFLFNSASDMHKNFYRNNKDEDEIADGRRDAEDLLSRLKPLVGAPPKPFAPNQGPDQRRLALLLGMPEQEQEDEETRKEAREERESQLNLWFPPRKSDPNGFSPNYGYKKPGETDDDGEGSGVAVDDSPPSKPPSPTALRRRERDEGDTVVEPVRGKSPRRRRKEPQAPAAVAAQSSRPGRERRQVIKPRPAAQRQSSRR